MRNIKLDENTREIYLEELNQIKRKIEDCIESVSENEVDEIQNKFIKLLLENL